MLALGDTMRIRLETIAKNLGENKATEGRDPRGWVLGCVTGKSSRTHRRSHANKAKPAVALLKGRESVHSPNTRGRPARRRAAAQTTKRLRVLLEGAREVIKVASQASQAGPH